MAVAQGIFDATNKLIGTLVGTMDLTRLSKIMQSGAGSGETDESYLVSDDGFLTSPRNPLGRSPLRQRA